ncbi:sensor histidine kinase [Methanolacinia paynteri]|uniref:sensor histidine kinase n=1 Tax=Methanolacinia paynteri TaxID=230356 RepID=UPI00064E2AC7|nr:HAMP domain-containing sensor histidine kinase [Methanolacinia paynteri]
MKNREESVCEEKNIEFLNEHQKAKTRFLKNISIVFILTFIFMSAYELSKQALFPGITIWTSHIVTIIVTTILAVIIASIPLLRTERLILQLDRKQNEIETMETSILKSNKKLNMLSSITRHDMLNLLTVITAYTEMIADADAVRKNPENNSYVQKIQRSVRSLNNVVISTRDYQDIGVNAPTWIDVRETFRKVYQSNSLFHQLRAIDPDEDIEIYADSMFERVLYNLMDNTMRHATGASAISLSFSREGETGCLFFRDDGTGIPEDEKEKIFNHSYGKNSGLGLFLVREILGITDIAISENGVPGEGACFRITIPPDKWRYNGAV